MPKKVTLQGKISKGDVKPPKPVEVTIGQVCDSLGWIAGQIALLRDTLCSLDEDQVIQCPPNLLKRRSLKSSIGGSDRRMAGYCPTPQVIVTENQNTLGNDRRVAGECPSPIVGKATANAAYANRSVLKTSRAKASRVKTSRGNKA